MKTYSFIGSDKNAWKNTVLNYIYKNTYNDLPGKKNICITSIGINGEDIDNFEGIEKPSIHLFGGTFFVTSEKWLAGLSGKYESIYRFNESPFKKNYILGKCIFDFNIVLEKPNTCEEVLLLKKILKTQKSIDILFIDGSIDRQFIASPMISDAFYFVVLFLKIKPQRQRVKELFFSLSIKNCSHEEKNSIIQIKKNDTKSILFDSNNEVLYHCNNIPFLDQTLKKICQKYSNKRTIIYLNGVLSKSLYKFFAPIHNNEYYS